MIKAQKQMFAPMPKNTMRIILNNLEGTHTVEINANDKFAQQILGIILIAFASKGGKKSAAIRKAKANGQK